MNIKETSAVERSTEEKFVWWIVLHTLMLENRFIVNMYIGPLPYLLSISTHLCIVFGLMLLMYGNRLLRRVLPDFNVSQSVFSHTSKYSVFNFFCNKQSSRKSKKIKCSCLSGLNLPYWRQTCTYRKHLSRLRFKVCILKIV